MSPPNGAEMKLPQNGHLSHASVKLTSNSCHRQMDTETLPPSNGHQHYVSVKWSPTIALPSNGPRYIISIKWTPRSCFQLDGQQQLCLRQMEPKLSFLQTSSQVLSPSNGPLNVDSVKWNSKLYLISKWTQEWVSPSNPHGFLRIRKSENSEIREVGDGSSEHSEIKDRRRRKIYNESNKIWKMGDQRIWRSDHLKGRSENPMNGKKIRDHRVRKSEVGEFGNGR